MGRTLGEIAAVTTTCSFALGATPGARLLAFALRTAIPGPAVSTHPRRNAG